MHCYRKTKEDGTTLYTVGYYHGHDYVEGPGTKWEAITDTSIEEEARCLVNYLNGGTGNPFRWSRS